MNEDARFNSVPKGNKIIDALRRHGATELFSNARVVTLERAQMTTVLAQPMETVDFPLTALMSIAGSLEDGTTCELAGVGTEAFVEIDAALRTTVAKRTATCLFAGDVVRVPLKGFQEELLRSPFFADLVYHAIRARVFITEQIEICNARHTVTQRLARWLLLAGFRAGRSDFPVSHESLGAILGTRRASISEATSVLEAREAIDSKRTVVVIRDTERLQETACECYAVCVDAIEESRLDEPCRSTRHGGR